MKIMNHHLNSYLKRRKYCCAEIYKTINQINHAYMWEFFVEKDMPYNLRTKVLCRLPQAKTNRYGLDYLSFGGGPLLNTPKN